jgi:hypothetical protein
VALGNACWGGDTVTHRVRACVSLGQLVGARLHEAEDEGKVSDTQACINAQGLQDGLLGEDYCVTTDSGCREPVIYEADGNGI